MSKLSSKIKTLRFILTGLLIIALTVLAGCSAKKASVEEPKSHESAAKEEAWPEGTDPGDSKMKLISGNVRYVSGKLQAKDLSAAKRKDLSENGQKPFAIVLTCSDSRVPPELVLDQGLGDIFVVRTAGNVVDPIAIGSIEYGVEHLHAPLIMVLGHEKCGAVKATVEAGDKKVEGNLGAIVDKIRPSVLKAKAAGATGVDLPEKAADENVKAV
ncbi:MAG TPA: carbonic anhydrase, partial [Desulfobacteria bacterium]|nr:carbonic anhydrase [Desulfobacteria bacterium]